MDPSFTVPSDVRGLAKRGNTRRKKPEAVSSRKRKASPAAPRTTASKRSKLSDTPSSRSLNADELPTLQIDVSLSGSSWRLAAIKQEQEESAPTEDEEITPMPSIDVGLTSSDDDTDDDPHAHLSHIPAPVALEARHFAMHDLEYSPFDSAGLLNCSFSSDATCLESDSPSFMPPLFEELF